MKGETMALIYSEMNLRDMSNRELAGEIELRYKGKTGESFFRLDDLRIEVQRRAAQVPPADGLWSWNYLEENGLGPNG
jgi:hypothetical protein